MKALTHIKIRQIATYQIIDLIKYNTLTPKPKNFHIKLISVDVP